jgi:predicted lipid-binding transport protein (Tim44 family)
VKHLFKNHKLVIIKACLLAGLAASVLNTEAANRLGMGRSLGRAPMSGAQHSMGGAGVGVSPAAPTHLAPTPAPLSAPATIPASAAPSPAMPQPPRVSPSVADPQVAPMRSSSAPKQVQQSVSQRSVMGSLIGGVATGLGVSWLMHSMGWGEQGWDAGSAGGVTGTADEVAGAVLISLAAIILILWIRRRLKSSASASLQAKRNPNFASSRYEGMGSPANPVEFQNYKSKNVGNDASARPWEGYAADTVELHSSEAVAHYSSVPTGFDARGFVNTAKQVFMTLQDAWDRSDMTVLHSMLTDQMLGEIKSQLSEREQNASRIANQTDVVTLQAELLGIQESQTEYLASVEFSGLIREDMTQGPAPFREVWSLMKPKDATTGWLVSGVQALQ